MSYIFVLENNDLTYKIDFKKNTNTKYDNKVFLEYNNYVKEKKNASLIKDNIKYRNTKTSFFREEQEGRLFLLKIYGMEHNNNLYIDNIDNITSLNNSNGNKKTNLILRYGNELYSKIKDTDENSREDILNKSIISALYKLPNHLNIGGNMMISMHNFSNSKTIDIIYLLLNFFEKIIIIDGLKLFCLNYKITTISQEDIEKIFNNNLDFNITPKTNLSNLIKYLEKIFTQHNKTYKTLLTNTEENYLKLRYNQMMELFLETGMYNSNININIALLFINYFRVKFNEKNKDIVKITSSISFREGDYIKKTIEKNDFKKCLEVGFANGISAVYILMNKNTTLTSIDPFQKPQWKSEGSKLLKKLDLNKNHKLIEKKSYEALPELLKKEGDGAFDFIFIDGWHTFDYTLVDFFYSDLLLKIGGIIIIDDALHAGVAKCVNYIDSNYSSFYKKLESHKTIASYKKMKNDDREWNFHKHF